MSIKNFKTSTKIKLKFSDSVSLSLKTNFSGLHMLSAAFFARQSAKIEKAVRNVFFVYITGITGILQHITR